MSSPISSQPVPESYPEQYHFLTPQLPAAQWLKNWLMGIRIGGGGGVVNGTLSTITTYKLFFFVCILNVKAMLHTLKKD